MRAACGKAISHKVDGAAKAAVGQPFPPGSRFMDEPLVRTDAGGSVQHADPGAVLNSIFGFTEFRPGQRDVVERLIAGEHAMVLVPTGGGKSLTYQLGALCRPGLGLVVSPLKALMQDQVRQLEALGVAAATVQSGTSLSDKRRIWQAIRSGRLDLLYVSPELLFKENGRLLRALQEVPLALIAVDEAHTVSHWGQGFRQVYRELGLLRRHFPGVPIAALTATADEETLKDVMAVLFGGPVPVIRQSFDRPNISLKVIERDRPERQLEALIRARAGMAGIIYVRSRLQADATARSLEEAGLPAMAYHAGMPEPARRAVMDRFVSEEAPLVVATIAFGMGIDRADIRFVVHRDLPDSPEAYYQEIGRAGRDGKPAEAILLYGFEDVPKRRRLIEIGEGAEAFKQLQRRRLDSLHAVVEASTCRKQALLRYFGEQAAPCGQCDICLEPPDLVDASDHARLLLEAIRSTGERFGRAHLVEVLRGARSEKIRRFGHDRLPVHGAGRALEASSWQALIRQMYAAGLVEIDLERHGILKAGLEAQAVLSGEHRVMADLGRSFGRKGKGVAPGPAMASGREATGEDAELFQKLRSLRLGLARERGCPPFIIFNDRTLLEMARLRPRTPEQLATVAGVGQAKLHAFGPIFLEEIGAHLEKGRSGRLDE
jgi:ATP-dependent DNA helicase RecQ